MSTPATVVNNLTAEGDRSLDAALSVHQMRGSHILDNPDAAREIVVAVLQGGGSLETITSPAFLNAAASGLVFWKEKEENRGTSFENASGPMKQVRQLIESVIRSEGPHYEFRQYAADALCDAAVRLKEPTLVAFMVNEVNLPPYIRIEAAATLIRIHNETALTRLDSEPELVRSARNTLNTLAKDPSEQAGLLVTEAVQNRANDPYFLAMLITNGSNTSPYVQDAQARFLSTARNIDSVSDNAQLEKIISGTAVLFDNSYIDLNFRSQLQGFILEKKLLSDMRDIFIPNYGSTQSIGSRLLNDLKGTVELDSPQHMARTNRDAASLQRATAKELSSYELLKTALAGDEATATLFLKNSTPLLQVSNRLLDGRCAVAGDHYLDLIITAGTHEALKPIVKHILEYAVGISGDQYDAQLKNVLQLTYSSDPVQNNGGLFSQHKAEAAVLVGAMKLLYTKSEFEELERRLAPGGPMHHKTQWNEGIATFLSLIKAIPVGYTPPVSARPINSAELENLW